MLEKLVETWLPDMPEYIAFVVFIMHVFRLVTSLFTFEVLKGIVSLTVILRFSQNHNIYTD